jgi:hypothetical protein
MMPWPQSARARARAIVAHAIEQPLTLAESVRGTENVWSPTVVGFGERRRFTSVGCRGNMLDESDYLRHALVLAGWPAAVKAFPLRSGHG